MCGLSVLRQVGTDTETRFASLHRRDSESNLDPTHFRMFSSDEGRWLSPDPLAGDVSNPQSLNRYAYVGNNPTTLTDPSGLCPFCEDPPPPTCDDSDPYCQPSNCDPDFAPYCPGGGGGPGRGSRGGGGGGGGQGGGGGGGGGGGSAGTSSFNSAFLNHDYGPIYPLSPWQLFGPPGTDFGCDFGICGVARDQFSSTLGGDDPNFKLPLDQLKNKIAQLRALAKKALDAKERAKLLSRANELARKASKVAHGADKAPKGIFLILSIDPCQFPDVFKGPPWDAICGRNAG